MILHTRDQKSSKISSLMCELVDDLIEQFLHQLANACHNPNWVVYIYFWTQTTKTVKLLNILFSFPKHSRQPNRGSKTTIRIPKPNDPITRTKRNSKEQGKKTTKQAIDLTSIDCISIGCSIWRRISERWTWRRTRREDAVATTSQLHEARR